MLFDRTTVLPAKQDTTTATENIYEEENAIEEEEIEGEDDREEGEEAQTETSQEIQYQELTGLEEDFDPVQYFLRNLKKARNDNGYQTSTGHGGQHSPEPPSDGVEQSLYEMLRS